MFESSEMLATLLASTPLMEEAWKLCRHANSAAPPSFAVKQTEDVTYIAFSGSGMTMDASSNVMVQLETAASGVFPGLCRHGQGKEGLAMVHAAFLNQFLSLYNHPTFQNQMEGIMNKSKSIIFTGHWVGGTIASLSTLWLLSRLATIPSPPPVLCITFGSPMLGNESLSRTNLEKRWGGNFWHVVAQDDIVLATLEALSGGKEHEASRFWPFGSYMFCTSNGAICLDHPMAILELLHAMYAKALSNSTVLDHINYEEYISMVHWQFLKRSSFTGSNLAETSYDAGVTLALQSSTIYSHESIYGLAKDSLEKGKQGLKQNLNIAKLSGELSNIKTLRVQIEWYKAFCDESEQQMGYYDSFKFRCASKRENKVNLNRIKLASIWNKIINMFETNELPYDFHKQARWVNGSQFYKLLVEPLEIAEYYRKGLHLKKGHYLDHGREKRYKMFDKWWSESEGDNGKTTMRDEYASLTQDSCFWARVEEARDWLNHVTREADATNRYVLLDKIKKFEKYAKRLIEMKEVSKDVLAQNSSYSLFDRDWREMKSQLQLFDTQLASFLLE